MQILGYRDLKARGIPYTKVHLRRLWEAVGFEVSRLLRIRYGSVELPRGMRPGSARRADEATLGRLWAALSGS